MTDISNGLDKISHAQTQIKSVTGRSRRTSRVTGAYWGQLERGERNPTCPPFHKSHPHWKVPRPCTAKRIFKNQT